MDINLTSGPEDADALDDTRARNLRREEATLQVIRDRIPGPGVRLSPGEAQMIADLLDELGAAMAAPDPK